MRTVLLKLLINLIFILSYLSYPLYGNSIHYISRDTSQLTLHPLNWQDSSAVRKQINLNGEWMALFGEDEMWQRVIVPGATDYEGLIIFRRFFVLDSTFRDYQFKFVALGINYHCQIFINRKLIGTHGGGSTSFGLAIEPGIILLEEKNEILIQVDTRLDARRTLPVKFRPLGEKNYGGILRDVFLLAVPKITIDLVKIQSKLNDDNNLAHLKISVDIRKSTIADFSQNTSNSYQKDGLSYRIELWDDSDQKKPLAAAAREVYFFQNTILDSSEMIIELNNPKVWSPESPYLYSLKILLLSNKSVVDEISFKYGIRDLKLFNQKFMLNGESLYLKGVTWHEYAQSQGMLLDYNLIKKNVLLMKELGANCVRVVGHSPHPYFSQLCSQYGLILFQELPVWSVPGSILKQKEISETVQVMLKEMVERDQNQAAVMAWGFGSNVDSHHPETKKFIFNLQDQLLQIDDRPSYVVVSSPDSDVFACAGTDIICLELLNSDIIEFNQILNRWSKLNTKQAKIISFGYAINQAQTQSFDNLQKQSSQRYQLNNAFLTIQKLHSLAGMFIISMMDWESELPVLAFGLEQDASRLTFGMMDSEYERRISFQITHSYFKGDIRKPIPFMQKPQEQPDIFIIVSLALILFFLFIYRRQRRVRLNISRSLVHPHGLFTEIRENRRIPAFDTFFILIIVSSILSIIASSCVFYLRSNFTFDKILNLFIHNIQTKAMIIKIFWSPEASLIVFFVLFMFVIHLVAIFTKLFAFVIDRRISFSQSINFSIWTTSIYVILLPLTLLFYRLLAISAIHFLLSLVFGLFHLWYLLRFINGLKVLYFIPMGKLVLFFCGINLIFWGSLLLYFQHSNAIIDYLAFYL